MTIFSLVHGEVFPTRAFKASSIIIHGHTTTEELFQYIDPQYCHHFPNSSNYNSSINLQTFYNGNAKVVCLAISQRKIIQEKFRLFQDVKFIVHCNCMKHQPSKTNNKSK